MSEFTIGILGVVALVLLVFLGVRVFIAAAAVGLVGLVAMIGWESGAGMVGTIPHSKSVTYTLSVLPMFILIGFLAFHAGLTEKLFDAATTENKKFFVVEGGNHNGPQPDEYYEALGEFLDSLPEVAGGERVSAHVNGVEALEPR